MRKHINIIGLALLISMAVFASCNEEDEVMDLNVCGAGSPDWPKCLSTVPPPTLPN